MSTAFTKPTGNRRIAGGGVQPPVVQKSHWRWLAGGWWLLLGLLVQRPVQAQTFCAPDATAYYSFERSFQDRSSFNDSFSGTEGVTNVSGGTPTFSTTAKVGASSAYFNGSQYARYDDATSGYLLDGGQSVSVMFWFKADSPGTGSQVLFEQGDNGNGLGIRLNNGVLQARVRAGGTNTDLVGPTIADTDWHHVALTYLAGASQPTRLYLDGTQVATGTPTQVRGASTNQGGIGASLGLSVWVGTASNTMFFSGYIDDFVYSVGTDVNTVGAGSAVFSSTVIANYVNCVNSFATNNFTCDGSVYFGIGNGSDYAADFKQYTYSTNSFSDIHLASRAGYNGIGYNQVDNFIYGIRYGGFGEDGSNRDGSLLRIGKNGIIEDLGFVAGLPTGSYNSGDVSPTGILYVTNSNQGTFYAINLNVIPYVATAFNFSTSVYVGDWAINPADNHLYSVDLSGRIEKINPTTGAVTIVSPSNGFLPAANYAGIWFDQYGNMYASSASIIRYNFTSNTWTRIGPMSSSSGAVYWDAAVCPVIKSDPAIAKTLFNQSGTTATFDITLSNNGPSPAADVIVRDILPTGLVYQSHQVLNASGTSLPSTDYSMLQVPTVGTNGSVQMRLNNLNVGDDNKVVLRLTVRTASAICNQSFTNCTEITSVFGLNLANGDLTNPSDNVSSSSGDVAANNEACAPVSFSLTPAAPTATASATAVCSGQSFSITYTNIPADGTLLWTRMPDGSSGTGNVSQVLSNTTTAPISYTYTSLIQNLYNCPSPPTVTVVTVNPTPIITPSLCSQTICSGETGVISFTSSIGGTTINWLRMEDGATGSGDISELFTTAGTYTYKIWGTSPAPASCPTSGTITCTIVVDQCTPCSLTAVAGTPVCDPGNATYSVSVTATDATGLNVSSGTVTGTAPEFTVSGILAGVDVIITPLGSCTNASPITVTAPNCCSIATPTASVTSQPICNQPTGTITVTSPLTGVTYSFDGGLTFQVSNVKSGLAGGTNYNIVVKDDITGCLSDAVTLTVNSVGNLRASASSNSPVCSGTLLQLIASQTGGSGPITYSWAGPNGFNSTLQNPGIASPTAAAGGSYTVTVMDATCSVTATTAVTIATQPDLAISGSPTLTICSGQSTVLNISGDGGANVVWTNTLGETGTGTTINFGGILNVSGQPQTIAFFVTASAGGCSDSTSVWLTINPAPALQVVPSRAIYCSLEETNIVATASSGTATITWTRSPATPDPPTPSGNGTGSVTINQPLPAGSYTYTITATENGCSSTPAIIPITVNN